MQSGKRQFNKPRRRVIESIIHNFSSYKLSPEEEYALSFSLDQHIPDKFNKNQVQTEFENFYYHVLQDTKDLDQEIQDELKSKMRRTSENYSKIKIPYQQQKVISNLSNIKSIIVIKQDKGRGIVILDRKHYIEKCLSIVESKQFKKLKKDPTKTLESKVQQTLRKIKNVLSEKDYKKLYPTGSQPGLFYGTAKVHKLQGNQGLNELTVRPIISNIGTASYETAKYLNNLLSPLGKSQHTVPNSKEFVEKTKEERIPIGYKMISFDVKSLFTNVSLDEKIETILQKVYVEKKIKTSTPKPILKELLLLCTKHLHFRFNGETYTQIDGVAMGSPLGPLLANIFMISLEERVLPKVSNYLCYWKRYVDDTYAYVVPEKDSRMN